MNARLAMLVLVSGLFVAAWNSDHGTRDPHSPQMVARRERLNSLYNQRAVAFAEPRSQQSVPTEPQHRTRPDKLIARSQSPATKTHRTPLAQFISLPTRTLARVHSASGRLINLPTNITPGYYRVVDTDGEVDTIVIPGVVSEVDDNLYQRERGDDRTYFIRLESDNAAGVQSADRSTHGRRL